MESPHIPIKLQGFFMGELMFVPVEFKVFFITVYPLKGTVKISFY